MKKNNMLMLAAAFALASCTQDGEINNLGNAGVNTLVATTAVSRVAIDDNGVITWSEGDEFIAFQADNVFAYYELQSGDAGKQLASFNAKKSGVKPVRAFFPLIKDAQIEGNKFTVTLPTTYKPAQNSQNLPMWGTVTGNTVKFKNLTAIFRFKLDALPQGYDRIRIKSSKGEFIAGAYQIADVTATDLKLEPAEVEAKDFITVIRNANVTQFDIPIPAATYTELNIVALNNQNQEPIQLMTFKNQNIEAGKLYRITRSFPNVISFDEKNFVLAKNKNNVLTEAPDKWFGLPNDKYGEVTHDADGLKLIGKTESEAGTAYYNGCAGGYCFSTPMKKGLYKLTFEVKASVDKGPDKTNASRVGVAAVAKQGWGYAVKYKYPETSLVGETGHMLATVDPTYKDTWYTNTLYVDFSVWSNGNSKVMELVPKDHQTGFELRFWPQKGQTVWIKNIQLTEIIR